MTKLPAAAHQTMARQHGVASRAQLTAHGISSRQVEHLVATGQLINVERGAYGSPSVRLDELGRCAAICLARPDAAIAGPTAGRLWGLRHVSADRRLHIIVPPRAQPASRKGVAVYRTAAVRDDDIVHRPDGIRVTTRARTCLDLARHLDRDDLLSVIEQAMRDGRLGLADMRSVAVDWISPQRPWLRTYLEQLDRRIMGPAAESRPEVDLGQALVSAGVTGLVRQHSIDLPGYGRARFDLAAPHLRWAIELDVHPVHEETTGRESDERRDAAAISVDWLVTRVTRARFEHSLVGVVDQLLAIYRARSCAAGERNPARTLVGSPPPLSPRGRSSGA